MDFHPAPSTSPTGVREDTGIPAPTEAQPGNDAVRAAEPPAALQPPASSLQLPATPLLNIIAALAASTALAETAALARHPGGLLLLLAGGCGCLPDWLEPGGDGVRRPGHALAPAAAISLAAAGLFGATTGQALALAYLAHLALDGLKGERLDLSWPFGRPGRLPARWRLLNGAGPAAQAMRVGAAGAWLLANLSAPGGAAWLNWAGLLLLLGLAASRAVTAPE